MPAAYIDLRKVFDHVENSHGRPLRIFRQDPVLLVPRADVAGLAPRCLSLHGKQAGFKIRMIIAEKLQGGSRNIAAKAFIEQVGYPVIAKPDIGVGANGTVKINSESELISFYEDVPSELYVMEQFLCGDICTYDAVIDSHCEPLFESMCTYPPVIDSVHNDENVHFYTTPDVPEKLRDLGRKAVKAFGADSRFVHFEFINLKQDCEGVGKAGDFAVMEVNMRPAGGHDPDMMNYAQSTDVFRIYAEMVTQDRRMMPESGERYICAYAARKDGHTFTHTHEEIMERYGSDIVMQKEMPAIDWPSMGRYVYMARFKEKAEMDRYFAFVLE